MWFVYIIEANDSSFYTGITKDVYARFLAHKTKKGAKYFYARQPICIMYVEVCEDRSVASKREYAIKKLSKREKQSLIDAWLQSAPKIPCSARDR